MEKTQSKHQPHPDITTLQDHIARAKKELVNVVSRVQSECKHPYVLHAPAPHVFELLGAMRICPACGYEEWSRLGSPIYWGTGKPDGPHWNTNNKLIFGDRPIHVVGWKEIIAARIN